MAVRALLEVALDKGLYVLQRRIYIVEDACLFENCFVSCWVFFRWHVQT